MVKKPTLADLAAKKPAPVPAPRAEAEVSVPVAVEPGSPDRRKSIMVRVSPEGWKELRNLAAEMTVESGRPVTMQSLILDQINALLKESGRPPVA